MAPAPVPDRARRMDHIFGGKPVSLRDLCLSRLASVQRAAFSQQLRSGRAVDRAVYPAPAQQRSIGGVDNGVHRKGRDISTYDL